MILEANLKKSTLALSALTLALAAGLSACGGGSSSYTIGGVVVGLEYPGLVLSNNGEDLSIAPAGMETVPGTSVSVPKNVEYAFKNQVDYGDPYEVTVKAQPLHQECVQAGGNVDTAGRLSVINAVISCRLNDYTVGGTITGLTSGGLTLINGTEGGTVDIPANAEKFVFSKEVFYNETFGITVLKQPEGLTCTVSNGAGIMKDEAVTTVAVACRPNT